MPGGHWLIIRRFFRGGRIERVARGRPSPNKMSSLASAIISTRKNRKLAIFPGSGKNVAERRAFAAPSRTTSASPARAVGRPAARAGRWQERHPRGGGPSAKNTMARHSSHGASDSSRCLFPAGAVDYDDAPVSTPLAGDGPGPGGPLPSGGCWLSASLAASTAAAGGAVPGPLGRKDLPQLERPDILRRDGQALIQLGDGILVKIQESEMKSQ